MTSAVRTLLLLRHATAERAHAGDRDADRALSALGRSEAAGVGDFLRGSGIRGSGLQVDRVLCSPAVRTRETLDQLELGAGPTGPTGPTVDLVPQLYGAGPDELLELVSGLDAAVVLVVGHAPGIPAAVELLAGPGSSPAAAAAVAFRFPPGTLAHLRSSAGPLVAGSAALVGTRLPEGRHGRHFE